MPYVTESLDTFSKKVADILRNDWWAFIVITGMMGSGKSNFSQQLCKKVSQHTGQPFSYESNMTYKRSELNIMLDGDEKGEGQLPLFSSALPDELISMFFKRNWYDFEQIDGITLLNKCRDRHLNVTGCIPSFHDLDSAIYSTISFWIVIYRRKVAWVFVPDENPFTKDIWHIKQNEKLWEKNKNPYRCKNFVCEIPFNDWSDEEEKLYYQIRNDKRKKTEGQRNRTEKFHDIKVTRDALIKLCFMLEPKLTNKDLHQVIPELSTEAIRLIRNGER